MVVGWRAGEVAGPELAAESLDGLERPAEAAAGLACDLGGFGAGDGRADRQRALGHLGRGERGDPQQREAGPSGAHDQETSGEPAPFQARFPVPVF